MKKDFPRTMVGGVSLPRMIIGTNWLLGYSHTSIAADHFIKKHHSNPRSIADMLKVFLESGIDCIMGPLYGNQVLMDAISAAEDQTGKRMIIIDTPVIDVSYNPNARREAERVIKFGRQHGATFTLLHHSSVEQLVNKGRKTIDRLPDYLKMVRDNGLIPGLSCHMPELVIYSDLNGYDVETYIQIYNCMGFLMQIEIEYIHGVIWNAKKPVMAIKTMAAGRVSPFVGLTFAWHTLRPCDMVVVGCLTGEEAAEDIEISFAALENRPPVIGGRSSPNKTEIMVSADK